MKVYVGSSLFAEKKKLSEKYVELSGRHLEDAKAKFNNGLVSEFDLLKSEMQLKVHDEQLVIAESDLQVALLSFTEICGGGVQELLIPAEELGKLIVALPREIPTDSLLEEKPQIEALKMQQERARLAGSMERLRPMLNLVSSAGWKNSYLPDPDKPLFNFLGGVSMTFPLYDGGYTKHRRGEEQERINTLQLDIERLTSESRRHVKILLQELRKIEAKMKITDERLALARKALEIASVSYGSGLITNTEYLDTELDVRAIEIESLQDKYSELIVLLELKKELGYFPEAGNSELLQSEREN
jgi:outer membrane protein TolC